MSSTTAADPDRTSLRAVALAVVVSYLLVTAVGSLVGLATYSLVDRTYREANRALPLVTFAGNAIALLFSLWLLARAHHLNADTFAFERIRLAAKRVDVACRGALSPGFAKQFRVCGIQAVQPGPFITG